MMKLSKLYTAHHEFKRRSIVLLAPHPLRIPECFRRSRVHSQQHASLLAEMQRVRGEIYLNDGAIGKEDLTLKGLHKQTADAQSWHILCLDEHHRISGCTRYLPHDTPVTFRRLHVRRAALARSVRWGGILQAAVSREMRLAHNRQVSYAEVGGWALKPELRYTAEALKVALATYGLSKLLGGCLGITTATRRHNSSSILRRIGGRSLEHNGTELPQYYDARYRCDMEILRFDSAAPNPRYASWIDEIADELRDVTVVCASESWASARYRPEAYSRFTPQPAVVLAPA